MPDLVSSTAMSTGSWPGLGLSDVRSRISEIQRRIGVQAAMGQVAPATGPTGAAGTAGTAGTAGFQQALQRSMAGAGNGGALDPATVALMEALGTTPVYATKPASLPGVAVSDTMRAAGNGRLPDSMLTPVGQGGHRLAKPAADAFLRLVNAARRDGVSFGVNDSYRSYAEQVSLAERKGIYGQGGWAAVPGTSNHGWGLAVDLELDDQAQAWMRTNAWRYGFFEDVPDEPWHWTYRSGS
jgi:zinc D-Ala-D-Ala carboxypeptidase